MFAKWIVVQGFHGWTVEGSAGHLPVFLIFATTPWNPWPLYGWGNPLTLLTLTPRPYYLTNPHAWYRTNMIHFLGYFYCLNCSYPSSTFYFKKQRQLHFQLEIESLDKLGVFPLFCVLKHLWLFKVGWYANLMHIYARKSLLGQSNKSFRIRNDPSRNQRPKAFVGFWLPWGHEGNISYVFTPIPHRSNLGEKQFCLTPCFESWNTPECMVGWLTPWQRKCVEGVVHIQSRKKRELNQNCWLRRSCTVPLPHLMWPLIAPHPCFLIAVRPLQIALPSGNYRRSFSVS